MGVGRAARLGLGLAALHGSTPDVSIAGYGLGGGVGWYGRKHGLFTNSITAIELVTADGELRRVDADHEPELFWALRGGGGNFGVVTALEFRLFPIAELYAGALFFPWERSAEVLHAWRDWTRRFPTRSPRSGGSSSSRRSRRCPQRLRGKSFAVSTRTSSAPKPRARAAGAAPRARPRDRHGRDGAAGRARGDAHGPAEPVPYLGEHLVLGPAPREAIDAFVAAAGPGSGSTLVSAEIRHVGRRARSRGEPTTGR